MLIPTPIQTLTTSGPRNKSPMLAFRRIARSIGVAFLLTVGATGLGRPAVAAEQDCFLRAELVEYLGQRAHEAQSAMGLANNGSLLEVFTTDDQSTWTIFLTMPNGVSCVIGAGETWMDLAPPAADQVS
jgi:hypothetical protein